MRLAIAILITALAGDLSVAAQTKAPAPQKTPAPRRAPTTKPQPKPLPKVTEPAMFTCPMLLGEGVRTQRSFCDVPIGRDAASGVVIPFPAHRGPVTLMFDLHNRHTYSEEQVKSNRAYSKYTATVGAMASDNTLFSRAVVQSEFRTATDLFDRVSGGSGPGGLKAVAPTGSETIILEIPEEEQSVSIVGEKLSVVRLDGTDNFIAPGRPIAVISNVMLEYSPGPPPKPTPARRK
jgi:hypothetical protein